MGSLIKMTWVKTWPNYFDWDTKKTGHRLVFYGHQQTSIINMIKDLFSLHVWLLWSNYSSNELCSAKSLINLV